MPGMKESDDFGARMKAYEEVETGRELDPRQPVYARIDGRRFSKFTRDMDRPFDVRMSKAMIETTRWLVEQTNARIGYTQSDEISLVWTVDDAAADMWFGARIQKMVGVLASMASVKFISEIPSQFAGRLPHFDARLFQIPNRTEAANNILWRAMDARKNAIQMVAQSVYFQSDLQNRPQAEQMRLIADAGIDFDKLPAFFRLGSFLQRRSVMRSLTPDELARIPADRRPEGPVARKSVEIIEMPPFNLVANREGVIFDAEDPVLKQAAEPQMAF